MHAGVRRIAIGARDRFGGPTEINAANGRAASCLVIVI
ncbi:hypothetical protein OH687_17795 [Burkholderia anthina]|nr:hypothetical protein OH687_17795 [Burkholderia anthina]